MSEDAMPAELLGGRYVVGRLLGRGGMAEVHQGEDSKIGRTVAIKLLRADHARDQSFVTRFRREARSAGLLNHPNIVAVYDTGETHYREAGGASVTIPFIVMEYVDGMTLREKLIQLVAPAGGEPEDTAALVPDASDTGSHPRVSGHLDPDEAARVTEGVLDALAYSHRNGIVHRDIKPANVMVTRDGEIKVMDFGIARAIADANATMTQTQAVIGTAQYLSPEQAQGQSVDARSDLYSTGCLLFEILTGRPPFLGDSPVAIAYQHVAEAPPRPSQFNPDVSPAYDAIVMHALQKDRDHRYQSAEDFAADLIAARAGRPISAAALAAPADAGASTQAIALPTEVHTPAAGLAEAGASTAVPESETSLMETLDRPAVEPRRQRGRGWVWALLALLLIAAAVLGTLFFRNWQQKREEAANRVVVARVVGLPEAKALSVLRQQGLSPTESKQESSDTVAKGLVADQSLPADSISTKGASITLTVSTGKGSVTVPDVHGMTLKAAESALSAAGFTSVTPNTVNDADVPKGQAMGTDPASGTTVAPDAPLILKVSSGKVTVPDVANYTSDQALKMLTQAHLVGRPTYQVTSSAPQNTVLSQTPTAGSLLDSGAQVTIVVAKAPVATVTRTQTTTSQPTPSSTSPTSSSTSTAPPTTVASPTTT